MSEFDNLFGAIAGQESGGNYSAVNSRTGASGRFQIMPANVGPWSQKYLGRTVSLAEFRGNPAIQDQLARAVLQDYYNRYGVRGAAAAWYSGNPNSQGNYARFRSNEPSVGEYVDQVIRRMGSGNVPAQAAAASALRTLDKRAQPSAYSPQDQALPPKALGLTSIADAGLGISAADGTDAVSAASLAANPQTGTITLPAPKPAPQGTVSFSGGGAGNALRDAAIQSALKYVGVPYVWGGTSPNGLDCSGLTQLSLRNIGISIPRVSQAQSNIGARIPLQNARPGDLIGFDGLGHIAMYIGNGQMVEAPRPGLQVRVVPVRGAFAVDMSAYYKG